MSVIRRNNRFSKLLAVMLCMILCIQGMLAGMTVASAESVKYEGKYDIATLLSRYQFATSGDVTLAAGGHTVGPVAVGGSNSIDNSFADVGAFLGIPSYVNNHVNGVLGNGFDKNYSDLYYGTATGTIPAYQSEHWIQNPDYMDLPTAFEHVVIPQSKDIAENATEAEVVTNTYMQPSGWTPETGIIWTEVTETNVTIDCRGKDSMNVKIDYEDYAAARYVTILIDNPSWFQSHLCTISIVNAGDNTVELNGQAYQKLVMANGTGNYGVTYYNLQDVFTNNLSGSLYGGQFNTNGMNLVWNIPDAKNVTFNDMGGHLVAPNATVSVHANYEGGIIAKNLTGSAEGHFFPMTLTFGNEDKFSMPTPTPTSTPTSTPTDAPTDTPTEEPTPGVTDVPTSAPTDTPTEEPTPGVTDAPTSAPTDTPTEEPTPSVTDAPTDAPTDTPTEAPTPGVTDAPTDAPTDTPTEEPTPGVTDAPTDVPTDTPTEELTPSVTDVPTSAPTDTPTEEPTPGVTDAPTSAPTDTPTEEPTPGVTDAPTSAPTDTPTEEPTPGVTDVPTSAPTDTPTEEPTPGVTDVPTSTPTSAPTSTPTNAPTGAPSTTPDADKTGNLEIVVRDEETGEPVPGAEVTVTKPDGTEDRYTTDEDGKILIEDTVIGDYDITVNEVPDGFEVTTGGLESATVIEDEKTTHIVEVKPGEDKTGDLEIVVRDEETGEPVPGAEVTVIKPNGTEDRYTTDEDAKILIEDTVIGDYDITVDEVPDGYEVTTGGSESATVIEDEKTTHIVEIKPGTGSGTDSGNDPEGDDGDDSGIESGQVGGLEIIVRDEETGDAVAGAVVQVTGPDGTVNEYVTDANGKITIESTAVGEYEIVTKEVPDGYKVSVGETAKVEVVADSITSHIIEIVTSSLDRQPETGDAMNLARMLLIMLLCAVVMSFSVYNRKRIEK